MLGTESVPGNHGPGPRPGRWALAGACPWEGPQAPLAEGCETARPDQATQTHAGSWHLPLGATQQRPNPGQAPACTGREWAQRGCTPQPSAASLWGAGPARGREGIPAPGFSFNMARETCARTKPPACAHPRAAAGRDMPRSRDHSAPNQQGPRAGKQRGSWPRALVGYREEGDAESWGRRGLHAEGREAGKNQALRGKRKEPGADLGGMERKGPGAGPGEKTEGGQVQGRGFPWSHQSQA